MRPSQRIPLERLRSRLIPSAYFLELHGRPVTLVAVTLAAVRSLVTSAVAARLVLATPHAEQHPPPVGLTSDG